MRSVLVEAGPGSGKTRLLVQHYQELLNSGLRPSEIVVITYTEKAAEELLSRIGISEGAVISTIHGFCHGLLLSKWETVIRCFPALSELRDEESGLRILDAGDAAFLMEQALLQCLSQLNAENDGAFRRCHSLWSLSQIRDILRRLLHAEYGVLNWAKEAKLRDIEADVLSVAQRFFSLYQEKKQAAAGLDYADLIDYALQLLERDSAVRHACQLRYKAVLVDEFQDTDASQWALIQLLLGDGDWRESGKLFVVGDLHQSIYGFRGAEPRLFAELLGSELQGYAVERRQLLSNFRSRPSLITAFNRLFSGLFDGSFRPLVAQGEDEKPEAAFRVVLAEGRGQSGIREQIQWVAASIRAQIEAGAKAWDFAILARRQRHFSLIQTVLEEVGIAVQRSGGSGLFERDCVQDFAMGVLSLFSEDEDVLFWREQSGFAAIFSQYASVDELILRSEDLICNYISAVTNKCDIDIGDSARIRANGQQFFSLLQDCMAGPDTRSDAAAEAAETGGVEQIESRLRFYMRETGLIVEEMLSDQKDAVRVMSMHAAKGLEFQHVFVLDLDAGIHFDSAAALLFDSRLGMGLSYRVNGEQNAQRKALVTAERARILAEEKRLFYVACTRAKESLVLMGTKRKRLGQSPLSWVMAEAENGWFQLDTI